MNTIQNIIMTIDDKNEDKKLHYDTNWGAWKISALLSGTLDRYEYPTGKGILLLIKTKHRTSEVRIFSFRKRLFFEKKKKTENSLVLQNLSTFLIKKEWIKTNWGYIATKFNEWFHLCQKIKT